MTASQNGVEAGTNGRATAPSIGVVSGLRPGPRSQFTAATRSGGGLTDWEKWSPSATARGMFGLETEELQDAYRQDPWIWACVKRITDAMENARWKVFDSDKPDAKEVESSPLLDLIENPNPFDIWTDILTTSGQGLSLEGEVFYMLTQADGTPVEAKAGVSGRQAGPDLKIKMPECVWTLIGGQNAIRESVDRASNFLTGWKLPRRSEPIPAHAMALCKYNRPQNRYRGMGPVEAAFGIANELFLACRYQSNLLRKAGDPGGWIETNEPLGPKEAERFSDMVRVHWNKPTRAGETRFLNGASYKPNPMKARDMQYQILRQDGRSVLSGVFGVPRAVLGEDVANFAAFQGFLRVFWTITVLPILLKVQRTWNWKIVRRIDDERISNQRYRLDVSDVEVLQGDLGEQIESASKMVSIGVPLNTAMQKAGLELDPIDGGDVPLIKAGSVTLVSVAQPPDEPGESGDAADKTADPATTLNGAQITSLMGIITNVLEGKLPKTTAIQLIIAAFPFDEARANQILADVEEGSVEPPPPPAPFGSPGEEQPEEDDEEDDDEGVPVEEAIKLAVAGAFERVPGGTTRGAERLEDPLDAGTGGVAPDGTRPIRLSEPFCQKCLGIDRPDRRSILRAVKRELSSPEGLELLIRGGRLSAGGAGWMPLSIHFDASLEPAVSVVAEMLSEMPPEQLDHLEEQLRLVANGGPVRHALRVFASRWDTRGEQGEVWRAIRSDLPDDDADTAHVQPTLETREQRQAVWKAVQDPLTKKEQGLTKKVRRVFNDMRKAQLAHLEALYNEAQDDSKAAGRGSRARLAWVPRLPAASWANLLKAHAADGARPPEPEGDPVCATCAPECPQVAPGPRVAAWMARRPKAAKAGLSRLLAVAYTLKAGLSPEELEELIALTDKAFEEQMAGHLEPAGQAAWKLGEVQVADDLAGTGFIQATPPGAVEAIAEKAIQVAEGVTSTVADGVREAIARTMANGAVSVSTVQEAILEYFEEFKAATRKELNKARARARTIARTELGQVHARARATSINQAAEQGVATTKTWLAAVPAGSAPPLEQGGFVRFQHWDKDGDTTAIGTSWAMADGSLLEHPRAWGGAAHQVINCRCHEVANVPPPPPPLEDEG